MSRRSVSRIIAARPVDFGNLVTHSPLMSPGSSPIDPFIFLAHHGPQDFPPGNSGLPFEPHPHRGMETVTFILAGDVQHRDSTGFDSIIAAGGVQWMTAGRGVIHSELSSPHFKRNGGRLEILQLWLNLPARLKMVAPGYTGLQQPDIPRLSLDRGQVELNAISGEWAGTSGPIESLTRVSLCTMALRAGGQAAFAIPREHTVFCYLVTGSLAIGATVAEAYQLPVFAADGDEVAFQAQAETVLLFGHALPIAEPIAAQGPFVMNTMQEIRQAYQDYWSGKFGD